QNADEGDPSCAHDPARNGELERVGGCRPDYRIAIERRKAAVELEDSPLVLDGLGVPFGFIERVDGGLTVGLELLRGDRTHGVALSHAVTPTPSAACPANRYHC